MTPETREFKRRMTTREYEWLLRNHAHLPSEQTARLELQRQKLEEASAKAAGDLVCAVDAYDQLWED